MHALQDVTDFICMHGSHVPEDICTILVCMRLLHVASHIPLGIVYQEAVYANQPLISSSGTSL